MIKSCYYLPSGKWSERRVRLMARRGENIYKRKDGRWEGRYKTGIKPDGKTKNSSVYGKSYSEVKALLNEKRKNVDRTATVCPLTVKELFDLWFEHQKYCVKESMLANYAMKADKHILPALGGCKYEKLTVNMLNDFVARKLRQGLSPKYVSDIVMLIKTVCRFAYKHYNYANKAESVVVQQKREKHEFRILSRSEQAELNNYLHNNHSQHNIGIFISAVTGMRIGEVCALKWFDIDLEKRIITVSRTVQRIADSNGTSATKVILTTPKSNSSVREIPIPAALAAILREYRRDSECFVLSGSTKPLEPRTLQYRFRSLLKKLGLTAVNFHSLRHAFATTCIELGVDVKTLSELLGHSSVEITLNRYVHSSLKRKEECMALFSKNFAA